MVRPRLCYRFFLSNPCLRTFNGVKFGTYCCISLKIWKMQCNNVCGDMKHNLRCTISQLYLEQVEEIEIRRLRWIYWQYCLGLLFKCFMNCINYSFLLIWCRSGQTTNHLQSLIMNCIYIKHNLSMNF